QKHPAGRLDRTVFFRRFAGMEYRPPPGTVARARRASASLARAPFRIDQRAQVIKAIGRYQTSGDQFPKRSFDFGLQLSAATHDISEKRCASLTQKIEHKMRTLAKAPCFGGLAS